MKLINVDNIAIVDKFIGMYGDSPVMKRNAAKVIFRKLRAEDNDYKDIMARLGNEVYISEEEVAKFGFTEAEIYAAIAHELGHVVYATRGWDPDCEQRADSFSAELGLGESMINIIEKLIYCRRYPRQVSQFVARIHYLQNIANSNREMIG